MGTTVTESIGYRPAEPSLLDAAVAKFQDRTATVALLGLGYAGLPLALRFAESGFRTIGLDIDPGKVEKLQRGDSYIGHISSGSLRDLVKQQKFTPSSDFDLLHLCDAAIICVPTPLGVERQPDLTFVANTSEAVATRLHSGQLVVLESTTYPGTTDEVVRPILSRSGLRVGRDYFLAFSPEREDPANGKYQTRTIPKVVGGVTEGCGKVALAAYSQVVDHVVPVSSARVAEAAKLLENIYRCVNIAMVNELKLLFERMDIDVWEVIEAAATKPFGFTPFYPGPGLGGHCIPVDPFYLSWKAREYQFWARFIELAGQINSSMPAHVVDRLAHALNARCRALNGAQVLILGVAYKANVDDVRESPALEIIDLLKERMVNVRYHDPHVPLLRSRHLSEDMTCVALTPDEVAAADAVIIVTDHAAVDYRMVCERARLVIDTRNVARRHGIRDEHILLA